jgi:hypothetical protein
MTEPACARADDRLAMLHGTIDVTPLVDRWRNADEASQGIEEIGCVVRDGQLYVRARAVGPDGPIDWGEVPTTPHTDVSATGGGRAAASPVEDGRPTPHYADTSVTEAGPAFAATFDHGFLRTHLQARLNLGVLVVAMFNDFVDDSGRSSYFAREVFVRASRA